MNRISVRRPGATFTGVRALRPALAAAAFPVLFATPANAQVTPFGPSNGPQEFRFDDHAPYPEPEPERSDPETPPGTAHAPPPAGATPAPDEPDPEPRRRVLGAEIGLLLGGATNPDPTYVGVGFQNGSTELGFAFGGRAGLVFLEHLYVGLQIVDYKGGSRYIGATSTPDDSWNAHAFQEGVDLGWGITWRFLTVRPQLGLGNITFGGPPWNTPADFVAHLVPGHSSSSLYLEPGVTALVGFGPLFVGADVAWLDITRHAASDVGTGLVSAHAWTAHGQVGVRL